MLQVAEATNNGHCKHEPAHEKTEGQAKAAGRDGQGRFAAGNKGGPGNPFARQTAGLRKAALRVVSTEDMEEVFRQLTAKAKSGDVAAIKLLLSYTVGKPEKAVDPDTLDQQEWKLLQQNSIRSEELQALLCLVQMPLFLKMVRAVLPGLQEAQENKIHKAMTDSLSRPVGEVVKEYEDEDDLEKEEDAEELEQAVGASEPGAPSSEGAWGRDDGRGGVGATCATGR